MHFLLDADKSQQSVTGVLPGHYFHRFGSPFEFLVQPLNDIGGTKRDPFLLGKLEEGQAATQGVLEALYGGRDILLPPFGEPGGEFHCFLPAGGIEDRTDIVRYLLLQFLRNFSLFLLIYGVLVNIVLDISPLEETLSAIRFT